MTEHRDDQFFTVVFAGDIRKFGRNPFRIDTPFGMPQAISMGDKLRDPDLCEVDGEIARREALDELTAESERLGLYEGKRD